jgi:HD-GYP domain-containing protein (c-di-GMP phosphodiesterase class II)
MMTIADIFDALVAWNRPYKSSVPVERALTILGDETREGKLDPEVLRIFLEAKIYDRDDFKALLQPKT